MVARFLVISAVCIGLQGGAAFAQSGTALIDQQLSDQIDFRDIAFSSCFEQLSCDIDVEVPSTTGGDPLTLTVSISAERDMGIIEGWQPVGLYWDPVDGLGVLDGGQNDEIDFNERMTIALSGAVDVRGMWFSDMFIGEQSNYGVSYSAQEDLEAADVIGSLAGVTVLERRVTGQVLLPEDPFNMVVSGDFIEGGDTRNRALIDDGTVTILVRDETGGAPQIIRTAVGQIDPSKLDIFAGTEVIEIDATTLLGETEFAPLLEPGLRNQRLIEQALSNQVVLTSMYSEAGRQRLISDVPNGEVGVALDTPVKVDRLVFSAELMTSNDYSIAGLVVEN